MLRLDYQYADWILNFRRRYRLINPSNRALLTSYIKNRIMTEEEEKRLFHLLQFFPLLKAENNLENMDLG